MKPITLPAGTTHVLYGEIAGKLSDAIHPATGPGDDRLDYHFALLDLEKELKHAVIRNLLAVKNPNTLGPHTFPIGEALRTALVTVNDLRAYVADRGIEVIVDAAGAKPLEVDSQQRNFLAWKNTDHQAPPVLVASPPKPNELCMLMDVSICIAEQKGWQNSGRESFLEGMMTAASKGKLTLYDPETGLTRLPKFGSNCPDEFSTPEDVNKWLKNDGGRLTWVLDRPQLQGAPVTTPSASGGAASDVQSVNARQAKKSPETLAFEKAACEAMTNVWNDYQFNKARDKKLKEPMKAEMHLAAINKLINAGISSKNKKPTVGMVCDAAKRWKKPAPMPVPVALSITPQTRHSFKGDK